MPAVIRVVFMLCCCVLLLVACDDDPGAPPADEPPAPLIEGDWTLRIDHDGGFEPLHLPGSFSGRGDTLVFAYGQGEACDVPAGRVVEMSFDWWDDGRDVFVDAEFEVAVDRASLTGAFTGGYDFDKGAATPLAGTCFGVPGDSVPQLEVRISPSWITVPGQAQVQMAATVDGWSGNAVSWRIEPDGAGSINDAGVYQAPWTPPEPPVVSVIAMSRVDAGARDTAQITIEMPPTTCLDLQGEWTVWIYAPGGVGIWATPVWTFIQQDCSATLSDRGNHIDLAVSGGYAFGIIEFIDSDWWEYWEYELYFRETTILSGSNIRKYDLEDPLTPRVHPLRGFRHP